MVCKVSDWTGFALEECVSLDAAESLEPVAGRFAYLAAGRFADLAVPDAWPALPDARVV